MTTPATQITNAQLRELFERHCECRPLDMRRTQDDHAAIHDCDTEVLHDVQLALGLVPCGDDARIQARARCGELFHARRTS